MRESAGHANRTTWVGRRASPSLRDALRETTESLQFGGGLPLWSPICEFHPVTLFDDQYADTPMRFALPLGAIQHRCRHIAR